MDPEENEVEKMLTIPRLEASKARVDVPHTFLNVFPKMTSK